MDKIWEIAKKHKLIVIEDACHALGAKYKNNKIGSCKYSDMCVFSFHPVKPITTGEGGAVLTNNKKYYQKLLSLRSHGVHKDNEGKNVMTTLGYNYRLTDIQASLGVSQLKKLDKFIEKRRQVVRWYEKELKDMDDIVLPRKLPKNYSGWHLYIVRVKDFNKRDKLVKFLKSKDIGVNFHYPAVYSHPYYRENGYKSLFLKNEEPLP
jgi:dTDP-4-amino-4,6-dideoxygalactose transaminase